MLSAVSPRGRETAPETTFRASGSQQDSRLPIAHETRGDETMLGRRHESISGPPPVELCGTARRGAEKTEAARGLRRKSLLQPKHPRRKRSLRKRRPG